MKTRVFSEIQRLKKVLVHTPGREIDVIVPEKANDLLFEDILFGERAQEEHQQMCQVLNKYGVITYDTLTLIQEAFEACNREDLYGLLLEIRDLEQLSMEVFEHLAQIESTEDLARCLVEGIVQDFQVMDDVNLYKLRPIPNLMFARDPVIVAFDRIFASSMAEPVRQREARLMRFVFSHHPQLANPANIINLQELSKQGNSLTLEGGDFLVINEETVAIAWSVRTSLASIHLLIDELKKIGVRNLLVVKLPPKTSFIHLDTVFTRINYDECLIYPPLFAPESLTKAMILYFDLTQKEIKQKQYATMFEILKKLKIDLRPLYCGGHTDLILQKREQWTHGANAFCIAPGVILTYARNARTIKELSRAGYLTVSAHEVLRPSFEPNLERKTAILLEGDELCRARGGPRCLTHPLVRE